MDKFEEATRTKLRFPTIRGLISVEDLWDLPLQSKTNVDLDSVAKAINRELKGVNEESFVTENTPANTRLTLSLDIVKHIIAVRLAENETKRTMVARIAERNKLLGILETKQDDLLKQLSPDELKKRLEALS